MTLAYTIDSIDSVDEALRGLYTEIDGKYRLQVDGVVPESDVIGLKNKNTELLGKLSKTKEALTEKEQAIANPRS